MPLYFSLINSSLDNSSITINGTAVSLGGSITLDTDDIGEGSSNLYYTDARAQAVSINNVVEDTTPQLGGTLDTNGNLIQFGDSGSATDDRLQFGASQDLEIFSCKSINISPWMSFLPHPIILRLSGKFFEL